MGKKLMNKCILPLKDKDAMGEVRAHAESAEVQAVLTAFKVPLKKQFDAIASRQSRILDPSKKPRGDGTQPAPAEARAEPRTSAQTGPRPPAATFDHGYGGAGQPDKRNA